MRNTWATYPRVGDNTSKGVLIPHKTTESADSGAKGAEQSDSPEDGPAAHQLVGEVTAHQGKGG